MQLFPLKKDDELWRKICTKFPDLCTEKINTSASLREKMLKFFYIVT